ncbi:putative secreted protein (Por secretion system target) [Ulvibacter antarcticus]|uniref:Putative secreted protein (Por secretion system target) n=1 Tax=Ulvibacter antarcticus TaxID=442714 RepID=A0A3L9YCQ8_9FLAO|nr:putative secreted protein (Por secretion system target) [Ulvibacter antarcticus]
MGSIDWVPNKQILLSINNLKKGTYILKIVQNKKTVKEITFIKY